MDLIHFDQDLAEVVAKSKRAGVAAIISCGVNVCSSKKSLELAEKYPGIYATAGIHPESALDASPDDIETIAELSHNPRVVAVGEIGLDFYREYGLREKQIDIFKLQLELSSKFKLPVVIHAREADNEMISILENWLGANPCARPGLIHCFNGSLANAKKYINMGFHISIGGYITYPSSRTLRGIVEQLPLDRLLVETDSPFLPPQSRRGERNEPAYIVETVAELAKIRQLNADDIAGVTSKNAQTLFRVNV